jgi:hypothetical protein
MSDFVPRSQTEITTALLAFANSDPDVQAALLPTDLAVGSLERAHIESLALLLEETDQRFAMAIVSAISESCYQAFGFSLLPPQQAVGSVIFSSYSPAASDISIPEGVQVISSTGAVFSTTADAVLQEGLLTTAPVPIKAVVAGVSGNVPASSINRMITPISGIDMVLNSSNTLGGSATETSDARASRFAVYLKTLVRGTKEALEFAALSASPAVVDARAIEPFLLVPKPSGVPDAGLVWLFVDDGTDNTDLDPGVETAVTQWVEGYIDGTGRVVTGYKSAGVVVTDVKVPRILVYVRASVSVLPQGVARWTDIKAALTAAAVNYFNGLRIGEKASYQNLVSALSASDSDISEVDMAFWKAGMAIPGYNDPLSAEDLVFQDPDNLPTIGARGSFFQGVSLSVTYPEWILAN